jgi:7-cyano-7-deazaguanine synthase
MDSIAIAYWLRPQTALTIDYGQRPADAEIRAASAVCEELKIDHHVIDVRSLGQLGSGDLSNSPRLSVAPVSEWWPFRNQMLITIAAIQAVSIGIEELLIGCLKTDGFHVDGSQEFVKKMDALLRFQEGGLRLLAPAIHLNAAELIKESSVPPTLLAWAHSCHVANAACGLCRGCEKHYMTLKQVGNAPY